MTSGSIDALIDANRIKPNLGNIVEGATETAVAPFLLEQPDFGQVDVSNERDKRSIFDPNDEESGLAVS